MVEYKKTVWNKEKKSKWDDLLKIVQKNGMQEIFDEYKHKLQSHKNPKIHHLARVVFSDYLLLLKSDNGRCYCITTGKKMWRDDSSTHPGHFRDAGESLKHKFNIQNVRPQSQYSNVMLNGDKARYTIAMINKYGQQRVEDIMSDKETITIKTHEYVERIIHRYEAVQAMKKQLTPTSEPTETPANGETKKRKSTRAARFPSYPGKNIMQ